MPYFLSLNFLAVPLDVCSLHCPFLALICYYSDAPWRWSFDRNFPYYISLIVLSIYHYYSSNFIHPFISLLSLIYILNITRLIKTFLGMAVEESHLEIGNTAFMVSFNFFFIWFDDFSRVFQRYHAYKVDYNMIFVTNKTEYFADLW